MKVTGPGLGGRETVSDLVFFAGGFVGTPSRPRIMLAAAGLIGLRRSPKGKICRGDVSYGRDRCINEILGYRMELCPLLAAS